MADIHEVMEWWPTGTRVGITYGAYVICSCSWHNLEGLTFPEAIDAYADHKAAQHG